MGSSEKQSIANNVLKAAAFEFFKQGFTVVPIVFVKEADGDVKKQPLVDWKRWQEKEQTFEEFEALPWERAEGWAVLCGKPNKAGLSVGVVDFDVKKTSAEAQELGRKAMRLFRVTARHKTQSGGEHLIFLSRKAPKSISVYHDTAALELLGAGKLCVMFPSKGYTKVNDNFPTIVDDLESEFLSILERIGVVKAEKAEQKHGLPIRPCFRKLMVKPVLSHDERVALVNELEHQGYLKEEVKRLFHEHRAWETDYNREKTDYQIESIFGKYGHFTRKELGERGICFKECERFSWPDCRSAAVVLPHLNMIESPDLAGKSVVVEAVVSSTSLAYLAPSKVEATVLDEDGFEQDVRREIGVKDTLNVQLVGVNELTKYRRLKRFLGLAKDANIREVGFRTVYRIRVRPPVFTLEKRGEKIVDERGFEYKNFDIYVVAEAPINFQPSSLIRLEGIPVPNPKTQQTMLLAYKIEFPEETYSFNVEKINVLKALFKDWTVKQRLDWILDNFECYSGIIGRRNLAEAGLLAFFTPAWIRLNGEIQKGWANVLFCGDTTTAKTETIRKLISLLKAGMLVTGETASAVGLTGTATQAEREGWFIDWGFLVLLDRKLLAVDGAHRLSLANWAALAEAERSGVVTIAKAAKNTAYARTRQIKIANPVDRQADKYTTKSLGSFLYACQALPTILDKTSIARLDLAVFSDQHDVSPEEINKHQNGSPHAALKNLSEVLKWCWSGQAEVVFTHEAVDSIHDNATSLYRTFFYEEIPIASIDMKWKLARLSAALAYLTLSTEDFKKVTVTKEHVELIADFIRQEYSKAGLNILAQTERYEALTLEDVQALMQKIGAMLANAVDAETLCGVLRYFVIHGRATREELKAKFSLTENNQLRPLLAALTSEGLIKTGRGFYPEPKLIQAYKVSDGFNFNKVNKVNNLRKESPNFASDVKQKREDTPSRSDIVKLVNLVNIDEVLKKLQGIFVEGTDEEFLAHAVDLGLSKEEAEGLFESLKGEKLFWFERDGKTFWRWIN